MIDYAKQELDLIGMVDGEDEMNSAMRNHIIHMVEEFSKEGHSGYSASYALGILQKILAYEPLSPLTGEDSEWTDVSGYGVPPTYQNKRCSRVFKDSKDGQAYDINGIVWYEWYCDTPQSENYKSYFTNSESKVYVEFPYTPKKEYKQWILNNKSSSR